MSNPREWDVEEWVRTWRQTPDPGRQAVYRFLDLERSAFPFLSDLTREHHASLLEAVKIGRGVLRTLADAPERWSVLDAAFGDELNAKEWLSLPAEQRMQVLVRLRDFVRKLADWEDQEEQGRTP